MLDVSKLNNKFPERNASGTQQAAGIYKIFAAVVGSGIQEAVIISVKLRETLGFPGVYDS